MNPTPIIIIVDGFPKSGNTWLARSLRDLLSRFLAPLNDGSTILSHGDDTHQLLKYKLIKSPDWLDHHGHPVYLFKSHFSYLPLRDSLRSLISPGSDNAIVNGFLVNRHPLEVFLSYLNYLRNVLKRQGSRESAHKEYIKAMGYQHSFSDYINSRLEDHARSGFLDEAAIYYINNGLEIPPLSHMSGSWISHKCSFRYSDFCSVNYADLSSQERVGDVCGLMAARLSAILRCRVLDTDVVSSLNKVTASSQIKKKHDDKASVFFNKSYAGYYNELLAPATITTFEEAYPTLL